MKELDELIVLYTAAWSEPDRMLRQQLLARIWTEDGIYTDPTAYVEGREALGDHIEGFLKQFPGAHFVVTSGIDEHHQRLRFSWRMMLADEKVFAHGVDFGELSPDGKLRQIVGFFEPLAVKS